MPKLNANETMLNGSVGSFQFSAVKLDELGSSEYTLVVIAVDESGSVSDYQKELVECLIQAVGACGKSPRAENLMIRVIAFSDHVRQLHGFRLLNGIDLKDYEQINPSGYTALFDAMVDGLDSITTYSKSLLDNNFNANALFIVVTDGDDNASKYSKTKVKELIKKSTNKEVVESLTSILVAVNAKDCIQYLNDVQKSCGITHFVDIGDATKQKLAKLAQFVSKSISSTSQALGSGGPSTQISLTF